MRKHVYGKALAWKYGQSVFAQPFASFLPRSRTPGHKICSGHLPMKREATHMRKTNAIGATCGSSLRAAALALFINRGSCIVGEKTYGHAVSAHFLGVEKTQQDAHLFGAITGLCKNGSPASCEWGFFTIVGVDTKLFWEDGCFPVEEPCPLPWTAGDVCKIMVTFQGTRSRTADLILGVPWYPTPRLPS